MAGNNDTREPKLLASMVEGEKRDITWPCAPALNAGESIVGAVITCVRDHGEADASPAARIATPRQVIGNDVVQRFSADIGGVWYRLTGEMTTSAGRELVGQCIFFVRPL